MQSGQPVQHLIMGLCQRVEQYYYCIIIQYIRGIQDELCPNAINTSSSSPFKALQCSSDILMRNDSAVCSFRKSMAGSGPVHHVVHQVWIQL